MNVVISDNEGIALKIYYDVTDFSFAENRFSIVYHDPSVPMDTVKLKYAFRELNDNETIAISDVKLRKQFAQQGG